MDKSSNFENALLIWKDINGDNLIISILSKLISNCVGGMFIFNTSG